MLRRLTCSVLIFLLPPLSETSFAAEITVDIKPLEDQGTRIYLRGEIVEGDYAKVVESAALCLAYNSPIRLILDTPGGNALEAMEIGRFFRATFGSAFTETGRYSLEKEDIRCYSSGILIVIGAPNRWLQHDNYVFDVNDVHVKGAYVPIFGLHRPRFHSEKFRSLSGTEAQAAYSQFERLVRDYMSEMGASPELAERMFRTASDNVDLIPIDELKKHLSEREPFLDEWIKAKCPHLTSDEERDLRDIMTNTGKTSEGYTKYLMRKFWEAQHCRVSILIEHQRSVIRGYLSDLGLPTLSEIEADTIKGIAK